MFLRSELTNLLPGLTFLICLLNLPSTSWCLICRYLYLALTKLAKQIARIKGTADKNEQCLQCPYVFLSRMGHNSWELWELFVFSWSTKSSSNQGHQYWNWLCCWSIGKKSLPSKMFLWSELLWYNGSSEISDLRRHRSIAYKY